MRSIIVQVSLISPDAVAAVKVSESCLANSLIFVVRSGTSEGEIGSMGTVWKGFCPCNRGSSKWWRQ